MHDDDEAWAYKASSVSLSEVDSEIDSLFEPDAENFDTDGESPASSHSPSHSREATSEQTEASLSSARSRRSSLPLGAISFIKNSTSRFNPPESPQAGCSVKELLATLHRAASSLALCDPDVIAREITRRDKHLFLRIKVQIRLTSLPSCVTDIISAPGLDAAYIQPREEGPEHRSDRSIQYPLQQSS